MTDQNQPPVPPNEPTPPANPDFTAPEAPAVPEAPAMPEVPPAPAYGAPPVPPAPTYAAPQAPPAPAYGTPAPQYGAPANYGQPGGAPRTNTFAIVSLVASIVGFFTGITFLVGIIFGHISLSQIKKSGENGRGMAIAGLIIGYVGLLIGIIITISLIAIFTTIAVNNPGYSY